jgi:hypothetical protein
LVLLFQILPEAAVANLQKRHPTPLRLQEAPPSNLNLAPCRVWASFLFRLIHLIYDRRLPRLDQRLQRSPVAPPHTGMAWKPQVSPQS